MEKKKLGTPPRTVKLTSITTMSPNWLDIPIDPPVEVRPTDHLAYSVDPTGGATIYLRRHRSRHWKVIATGKIKTVSK